MCWLSLRGVEAPIGEAGQFVPTGLLGPPICPLTSGHQRLLQSSEGTPTLFWKLLEMASQKESGDGKALLLVPFGTPFLLSSIPIIPGKDH